MPIISVIIPNFNYERYVGLAIASVLDQDFDSFEIIVIDDGSTDRSWEVISSYANSHPTKMEAIKSTNQGQARASLLAISRARGAYIYVLDADDELCAGTLATIAQHLDSKVAKIQFPLLPIDESGNPIGSPFPSLPPNYTRQQMLHEIERHGSYTTPPTSGNVFRADIFRYIDDIPYERAIDGVSYLLAPVLGDVLTIYQPLARYRVHRSNASDYSNISESRFRYQRERFVARLHHLAAICATHHLPGPALSDISNLPYVIERQILEEIAQGHKITVHLLHKFWRALWGSGQRTPGIWQMTLLTGALFVVPRKWRQQLITWRYSPWSRPAAVRFFINLTRK